MILVHLHTLPTSNVVCFSCTVFDFPQSHNCRFLRRFLDNENFGQNLHIQLQERPYANTLQRGIILRVCFTQHHADEWPVKYDMVPVREGRHVATQVRNTAKRVLRHTLTIQDIG